MCGQWKRQTERRRWQRKGVKLELNKIEKDVGAFHTLEHCTWDGVDAALISNLDLLLTCVLFPQLPIFLLPSLSSPWSSFQIQTHSFHQAAESGTAAVSSSALCCPHWAPSVSYNFVQQQTGHNVALLSVCVHVCVSKSPFFHEWSNVFVSRCQEWYGRKILEEGVGVCPSCQLFPSRKCDALFWASGWRNFTPSSLAPEFWIALLAFLWCFVELKRAINNHG